MPTIQALHHVALTVPTEQLEDARHFYSGLLGLEQAERPEAELGQPGIWYRIGASELHIQCREKVKRDRSGRHPALIVDDVAGMKEHLRTNDIEVQDAPTLLGRERFFCRDPFGNRIEFMSAP